MNFPKVALALVVAGILLVLATVAIAISRHAERLAYVEDVYRDELAAAREAAFRFPDCSEAGGLADLQAWMRSKASTPGIREVSIWVYTDTGKSGFPLIDETWRKPGAGTFTPFIPSLESGAVNLWTSNGKEYLQYEGMVEAKGGERYGFTVVVDNP